MPKPEEPDSLTFKNDDGVHTLANAVMDVMFSSSGGPRSREEANLYNWANYILEGESYEPFDLSKFESKALYEPRLKTQPLD